MAKTKQDWYNNKGPFDHYAYICVNRNHQLISLSGIDDGSGKVAKGTITFHRNTCLSKITTTVASYNAARGLSKGSKICKTNLLLEREADKRAAREKPPVRKIRRRKWTKDSPLKTREAIRQHLLSDVNSHNTYVLELMDRKQLPKLSAGVEVDDCHITYQVHHIIPCTAGGEYRVYNEVKLTLYEHWKVDLFRFDA